MSKLSLCITTWNRVELTLKCFEDVVDDPLVDEIVIVDDCSNDDSYTQLAEAVKNMPKVKLYRNETNLDCYLNKREAISKATNPWCVLFDSDNTITKQYIDKIYEQTWSEHIALMPDWAEPTFCYTEFSGLYIDRFNVNNYMGSPFFETCLNCMNYFVNRDFYLKVFDESIDPVTSDSLFQNYNWLRHGGSIHIVKDLRYSHLVHNGSHYRNNCHRTGNFHEELKEKIRNINNEVVV